MIFVADWSIGVVHMQPYHVLFTISHSIELTPQWCPPPPMLQDVVPDPMGNIGFMSLIWVTGQQLGRQPFPCEFQ